MTTDEVRATLGNPVREDATPERTFWYYDCDSWPFATPFSVYFDKDGRVEGTHLLDW